MIEFPSLSEFVGYALTFWAIGWAAGKKLLTFIQVMEKAR